MSVGYYILLSALQCPALKVRTEVVVAVSWIPPTIVLLICEVKVTLSTPKHPISIVAKKFNS